MRAVGGLVAVITLRHRRLTQAEFPRQTMIGRPKQSQSSFACRTDVFGLWRTSSRLFESQIAPKTLEKQAPAHHEE